MRRGTRLSLLAAALAAGSAAAQDLTAYRALAASLDAAAEAGGTWQGAERTLTELDRAGAALEQLAPTLQNQQVVGSLRGALNGARAALARTPAEVQAQVLLGRGLLRKALYEQTLGGLAGAPANASAGLRLLAREFGLTAAATGALTRDAAAGRPERVAWRLQRAAAQKVASALQAARPQRSADSYLQLARASGWFTVVQEAGAAHDLRAAGFTAALAQLAADDRAALARSLTALRGGSAALGRSLAAPPALPRPAATQTDSPTTLARPAGQPPTGPAPTEMAPTDPAPTERPGAAARPAGSGSLDLTYAALGRALTASGHGDPETARRELTRGLAALASVPAGLRAAPGYEQWREDLAAAQERRGLRPGDVQALIAGLGGVERAAAGESGAAVDRASAASARTFSGGVRAAVFLLLALLAPLPLYLLHLAFGGRNPSWRAITAALALLLLPVFLEGLFGFLGWLGDVSGVALLRAAPTLTLWQGAYGLPLRALLTALAIGLATYGFWGLCAQFGLLGRRQRTATPPLQPVLDWEEEP
nr:hypothetical protein [Deinococcus budaensis]